MYEETFNNYVTLKMFFQTHAPICIASKKAVQSHPYALRNVLKLLPHILLEKGTKQTRKTKLLNVTM